MDLLIRTYSQGDWPEVSRIHDLARPIELEGSCDPRAFVPLADDAEDLLQFQQCLKLVACLNDRIVGFIGINASEVGWLYVDPVESGKGIGRQLLRNALAAIDGRACVHVLDGNTRALKLYQSEGFSILDRFNSKNKGYPCTVLSLSLDPSHIY